MKIRLVCVGKMSNAPLKALTEDYRKRLSHLSDVEIVEVKDGNESEGSKRLSNEADRIRAVASPMSDCILWDELGMKQTSVELSQFLDKMENQSVKRLTFIIGSSHGVSQELKAEIGKKFQLSAFTLTHEWARALVLEQLYRSFCIKRNFPYHH